MAPSPSPRTLSPFGSVGARGAEAAREVPPAPSQDPGLSLGLGAGRRLLSISRIKGGL